MNNLEQAVDYLNLHLGIVHGDVCPWNLLIDAETDSIQLFGFSLAAKLGWEGDQDNFCEFGYDKARNDVKFVIMTTYELITRKLYSRRKFNPLEEDACKLLKKRKWTTHEEAKLDSNVREYRRVLSDWVKQRTERKIDHFTKASEPLNWPPLVVDPLMAWDISPFRKKGRLRLTLRQLGSTLCDGSGRRHVRCRSQTADAYWPWGRSWRIESWTFQRTSTRHGGTDGCSRTWFGMRSRGLKGKQ